ncbi:hypothetical protein RHABOEDO_000232 [Candidatus Rhabdochlamydia oedothoracis]|uniref:Uncharacterized protein n=1 Tax=Candidatus Rhabdochlamydia oedothoracis TaxID=2720720 RepID=A0ABX8V4I4_9BACT|nr:hypothetical protein RHOW815_000884 [Candidatus Rhabdochlamydia sp. W815]QYF48129.1 hypothetical protein RHABOEDO_000232 [Candidatus Rhabdochlamydia oedothoracis]
MSCTMHVVGSVISHSKVPRKTAGKNHPFPDISTQLVLKKTISIAEKCITHIAETTTAKTLLEKASIVQPKACSFDVNHSTPPSQPLLIDPHQDCRSRKGDD